MSLPAKLLALTSLKRRPLCTKRGHSKSWALVQFGLGLWAFVAGKKTNPAADEVAGLASHGRQSSGLGGLIVRLNNRTTFWSLMVNSAQIFQSKRKTVLLSGHLPCLRGMKACYAGSFPSQMPSERLSREEECENGSAWRKC